MKTQAERDYIRQLIAGERIAQIRAARIALNKLLGRK